MLSEHDGMNLTVATTFTVCGNVPQHVQARLVEAVTSVPWSCFFDATGAPIKTEVSTLDRCVANALSAAGWRVDADYSPFADTRFNVDLAVPDEGLLVEIEKGKLPRVELDLLKIASACSQMPERWRYGALVVPATYIKLPLAGRQAPTQYLLRLAALVRPVLEKSLVMGLCVVGYVDPRESGA